MFSLPRFALLFIKTCVVFLLLPMVAFSQDSASYAKEQISKAILFIQEEDYKYALKILERVDIDDIYNLNGDLQLMFFAFKGLSQNETGNEAESLQNLDKCISFRNTSSDNSGTAFLINQCLVTYAITSSDLDHSNSNEIAEKSLQYLRFASNRGNSTASEIIQKFEADQRQRREEAMTRQLKALTQDLQKACLGMTEYPSDCYSVSDPDLKHLCIANSDPKYQSDCYSIKDKDLQHLCIAKAYPKYQSDCYSIQNADLKHLCIAYAFPEYRNDCYSIKTEPWRTFCGGIALSKSNCYNLR